MADPDGRDDLSPLDALTDLFDELLSIEDPSERDAFFDRVRARDPGLERELRELFDAHESDTRFLEDSLPDSDRALMDRQVEDSVVGKRIGPWEIDGIIQHGGMGSVYQAHRAEADFEQMVALKVIRLGTENADAVRRFTLERQLLARLEHPGIARLLDGGTTDDGLPYLVIEYIQGEPIDRWCDREAPSLDRILDLFRKVCEAVDFAHRNLVIHRDIKPANILVNEAGDPKLLDFGIAKLTEVSAGDDDITATRHRLMTPAWASPEQFRGEPVGTAADVYSLGMLLYRLLTGRVPYQIDGGTTMRDVERMICDTMPLPPSQVLPEPDPRRRRLGGDLDTIVLKALRKEPERRYPSALAFAEDIDRYRAGLPVRARPDTLSYRARRFVGRNWMGIAAAAAIIVALTGGLGAALWQGAEAQAQRDLARAEAATAESAVEFLKSVLWSGNPWDATESVETVEDVLRLAGHRIDQLGDEPATRAYILAALSEISTGRGEVDRASDFGEAAVALLASYPEQTKGRAAEVLRAHTMALQESGALVEAREVAERAIREFESRDPVPADALADMLSQMGTIETDRGEAVEAESWFRRALELRLAEEITPPVKMTALYNNLAVSLMNQADRLDEAVEAWDEAILAAREAGSSPPVIATLLSNRANVHLLLLEFEPAEANFLEAITLMRGSLGVDHPSTILATISLGGLYEAMEDLRRAEDALRPALATSRATLGVDHPITAYAQNVFGVTLCQAGDAERAAEGLTMIRESNETRTGLYPEGHWLLASGVSIEALCLIGLGRTDEARVLLSGAVPVLSAQQGEDHRVTVRARRWLERTGGDPDDG